MLQSGNVIATTITTSLIEIKGMATYSIDDPSAPEYSDLVALSFENISWPVSTSCNVTRVLVKAGDSKIVSIAMSAYVTKTPVKLLINDITPVPLDGFCFLRGISTF